MKLGRWLSGDPPVLDETGKRRREMRLGLTGVALVGAVAVGSATLYAVPVGKKTYTADLAEAQTVKAGDDIRVAGVPVGTVTSLDLLPDKVVMHFTVDSSVFVGDASTLDVRMLTVVGGYYVALTPAGREPLGSKAIPQDRVHLPYTLMQTFQDAITPLREVDGDTVRRNLTALSTSIDQAPDALRTTLDTLGTYVGALDRQRTQVASALSVADEYLTAYDGAKSDLGRLMDNVNLLETVLQNKKAELAESVGLLQSVIDRLALLAPAWDSTLKPKLQQLIDAMPALEDLGKRLGPVLDSVQSLQQRFAGMVDTGGAVHVDQSGQVVTAPAGTDTAALLGHTCVPVPGKDC
ncbi:MCE family protein [Nocardia stercoris]|uniref:MCE family protein n=2 Tax=Nocardia stercoris TaxID=2483361 RepID=A0A3M2L4Z1_9NOCA|nr:MCE family protein [Nocardia stercoris]